MMSGKETNRTSLMLTRMTSAFLLTTLMTMGCNSQPSSKDEKANSSSGNNSGWVSGGGAIIGDRANPWFIHNTDKIRYCIQIDETNFGASKELVKSKIEKTYAAWQKDLAPLNYDKEHFPFLATQTLVEENCGTDTDITFQFGVLTQEQEEHLRNPKDFVGAAVRTDYDRKNLKGKGFIYIAPEKGSYAPEGVIPGIYGIKDGIAVEIVLLHEWGHVFGLGHLDGGIMMELVPESVLKHQDSLPYFERILLYNPFGRTSYSRCEEDPLDTDVIKALGVTEAAKCFRLVEKLNQLNSGIESLSLYASNGPGLPFQLVGTGSIKSGHATLTGLDFRLYLTKEQSLYNIEEKEDLRYTSRATLSSYIISYTSGTNTPVDLQLAVSPTFGHEIGLPQLGQTQPFGISFDFGDPE